jgi:hypothetical protein
MTKLINVAFRISANASENTAYVAICKNHFYVSKGGEKTSIGVGLPSASRNRKGKERQRKMCRLEVIGCGLRLREVWNGYVKKLNVEF